MNLNCIELTHEKHPRFLHKESENNSDYFRDLLDSDLYTRDGREQDKFLYPPIRLREFLALAIYEKSNLAAMPRGP